MNLNLTSFLIIKSKLLNVNSTNLNIIDQPNYSVHLYASLDILYFRLFLNVSVPSIVMCPTILMLRINISRPNCKANSEDT